MEPVRQSLEVSDVAWNLDMAPVGGWLNREQLLWRAAMVLAVSLLLAYLARLLFAQRAYKVGLEVQVAERTAEILATQNQLKSTLDAIRDPMFEADLDGRVYAYKQLEIERV